jgi:hypothetical protein
MLNQTVLVRWGVLSSALALVAACGSSEESSGKGSTGGGSTAMGGGVTGGGSALGGSTGATMGGSTAGGGAAGGTSPMSTATGGTPTGGTGGTLTGGTVGTGGDTGGSSVAGGDTGGNVGTGGGSDTGGSSSTGGRTGFAGRTGIGGRTGMGGTQSGGTSGIGGDSGGSSGTGGGSGGSSGSGGNATGGMGGTGGVGEITLVKGLEISKLSLYQTVEVPLMKDWAAVSDRPADITQGKDALVRVFVKRQSGWAARSVRAAVEISSSGGNVTLTADQQVSGDSTDGDLKSTLNVKIPAAELSGDATYSVSLAEVGTGSGSGDSTRARWPESGTAEVGEKSLGGGLKLRLVPIQYDADGSGRLPDTSDAQLDLYREYFARFYPEPLDAIDLHVTDPMTWSNNVSSDGSGWDALLYGITDFMDQQGAARDEYYFGIFSPATSMQQYCRMSCVAGLAFVSENPSGRFRINAGIGLGFAGEYSPATAVHEVGHLHGRLHAPCDVSDADPNYPFKDGSTGVWGYDLIKEALKSPDLADFMGYCPDVWASAYTYQAIFEWTVATNASNLVQGVPTEWQSLRISSTGDVALGPSYEVVGSPTGRQVDVEWLDAGLRVLDLDVGYLTPFDNLPGGIVMVLPPPAAAVYVRVDGSAPVAL